MKFRYSIARYVPSVVRGEAINMGVLLESPDPAGLYVQFLGSLSRVRALFPDADAATIKLLRTHFKSLERASDGLEQSFAFINSEGITLEQLYRDCIDTILQLSSPSVTVGDDPARELSDLFRTFVSSPTATSVRPISAIQLAPSQLRRRVDAWFTKSGWIGPGRYRRGFELPGTVFPWAFDFGTQNGHATVVQTLALRGPVEPAMNRVLLLNARTEDVRATHPDAAVIVVADQVNLQTPPVRYLVDHGLDPIAAQDRERLTSALSSAVPALA